MRALLYLFLAFAISCQGIVVVTCHYFDYDIIQGMAAVNTQALLDEFGDSAVERYWLEIFRQKMDTTGNRILKKRALTRFNFSHGLLDIQPFCSLDSVEIQYTEKVLGCTDLRGRIKKRLLLYLENYDTLKLPILPELDRGSYRIPPYGMYVVTHIFPYPDSCYIPPKDKHIESRVYFGMDSLKKKIAELKQNVFTGTYIEQEMGIPFLEYPLKELLKDSVKPDSTWHHPIFR